MGIITFTDKSVINFGKHSGKRLEDVPAEYLLWLYESKGFNMNTPLGRYIKDNLEVLRIQDKNAKQLKR